MMKRGFFQADALKSSFTIHLLICYGVNVYGRITFGVVRDNNWYTSEIVEIIKYIMRNVYIGNGKIDYAITFIDPSIPLADQTEGICYSERDFDVLFSATSCDLLRILAKESSSSGILHFALNVDHCILKNVPVLFDRIPTEDVTQAIADVVKDRNKKADIAILHDTDYGICYSERDFDVLFSATSCDLLRILAKESSSSGILHFALNVDHCILKNVPVLLDRIPTEDVTQAIADVVKDRNKKADIAILHDTDYERPSTIKSLLKELIRRGLKYSYLLFDVNVTRVSRRVDMVRRGANQLSIVVLADFSEFKFLIDKMYEHHVLDSAVTYLIINDGWESENPEIDSPMPVNYTIDLNLLLLKRKIGSEFSNFLTDLLERSKGNVLNKIVKWKVPHIERGSLFIFAAVWSVVQASKWLHISKELSIQGKCTPFNETFHSPENNVVYKLVVKFMRENRVLSDSLEYDLFRNIPLDTKTEIFQPIAQWKVEGNPRLQYLSRNIESKLLFENKSLKLGMPFNPPYTFPAENENEDDEKGAVGKLFDYLTEHLKFKYKVLPPLDNEWGVMENGTWSGTIAMLLDRTVDLVPFLGLTQGRNKVIQFSEPVMTTCSAILVQKPREPPRTLIFLKPFSGHVWCLIIIIVPIMAFVLYLINKKSWYFTNEDKKKMKGGLFKFGNCFWYMYGAILQQGGIHLPETISARIIVCFWWLFVIVTMATYSGNLIAFLTFPEADWIVTSVHDLTRKQSSLTVAVQEGTSIHQEIKESPMETLQKLRKRFDSNQNAMFVSNISFIVEEVEKGKAVYIDDYYVLNEIIKDRYNQAGKCRLALAPDTFQELYLAIAARKGSPYMKDINIYIRHLWHGGLMQWWAEQYAQLKSHECHFVTTTLRGGRKDVTLRDLFGAFLLLVGGLFISSLIILCEVTWIRFSKHSSNTKKSFLRKYWTYYTRNLISKQFLKSKISK